MPGQIIINRGSEIKRNREMAIWKKKLERDKKKETPTQNNGVKQSKNALDIVSVVFAGWIAISYNSEYGA